MSFTCAVYYDCAQQAEARLAEVQSELEISRINVPSASLRGEIEQLRGRLESEDRASAALRESNLSLKQVCLGSLTVNMTAYTV